MNKNTEQFQWDESLAREFGDLCNQEGWHHFSGKKNIDTLLEQFKQSKSKTEQPQWEILSVLDDFGMTIYCPSKDVLDLVLKYNGERIHSVKRLRDGEVFSVGDVLQIEDGKNGKKPILSFELRYDGTQMWCTTDAKERYGCCLSVAEKAPKEEQVPIKAKEIEDGINTFESFSKGYSMGWKDAHKYNNKKYTEEQLLQARRDAFDAAREVVGYSDAFKNSPVTVERKYPTREDYINSLNK